MTINKRIVDLPNPPQGISDQDYFLMVDMIGGNGTTAKVTAIQLKSYIGGVTDHGQLTGLTDDDHTQYQLRSEKGSGNGYASLVSGIVPVAQLGTGTPTNTKFLRGDGTWVVPSVTASINVQDEGGVAFTPRTTLNFIGAAVTAADDNVNSRINITVSALTPAQLGAVSGVASLDGSGKLTSTQVPTIDHNTLSNLTTGNPHTQYQLSSQKGLTNGYASIGSTGLVPPAQLGTGSASSSTFLRGDGAWSTPTSANTIVIQDEGGSAFTGRPTLNFIGTGVSAADDVANNRINITVNSILPSEKGAANGVATLDSNSKVLTTQLPYVYQQAVNTIVASGASTNIDFNYASQDITMTSNNVAISFTNATAGIGTVIIFRQDGTGGRRPVWPGGVIFDGGEPAIDPLNPTVVSVTTFDGTNFVVSGVYSEYINSNYLKTAHETLPRDLLFTGGTSVVPASANFYGTYFTARKTMTVTNIITYSCTTATAGTTTARVGLYSVSGNGDLTLMSASANNTSLWTTIAAYTSPLAVAQTMAAGKRYAVGYVWIGTTAPTLQGTRNVVLNTSMLANDPRLCVRVNTGITDIPSSVTASTSLVPDHRLYAELT